ncbi:protein-serine O-palmitoleoyltransferase porcupine-like [Eucyclogobius newberryi]|uniref:protein-serine O-palmitoleoyltransferase porcupine-like n=1 Tax=Eucyclogobius newberryi TaxID=166745 RepID=UPI003B5CC802
MDVWSHLELWGELAVTCGLETAQQALEHGWRLLLLCGLCRLTFRLGRRGVLKHCVSAGAGVCALFLFFQIHALWVLLLCALSYLVLLLNPRSSSKGVLLSLLLLLFLLMGELHFVEPMIWSKIRGSLMVVAMKVISLAFDLDRGAVSSLPSAPQFLGYTLFVGSSVFGPWTSFGHYMSAAEGKPLSLSWFLACVGSLLKSLLCLVVSGCVAPYLFSVFVPISGGPLTERWLRAYENAVSFHFSNYFVGHLSECTLMLAGAGFTQDKEQTRWDMCVVRPLHVELPRSLIMVVTSWNIPMSQWLKTYVFKSAVTLGPFGGILVTYTASALLHGLSFHLGAVLLTLGFLTYTEHVLRKKLGSLFSACVLSRPCSSGCSHQHKKDLWVVAINLAFGFLSVLHLSYLGSMFDPGLSEGEGKGHVAAHTIQKWSELNWTSHLIIILNWGICRFI